MSSTDSFLYHINSEKQIIEISIQWNNRTIQSNHAIKLCYNNNYKKNLLENANVLIWNLRANKYFFKYPATEPLKLSYTLSSMPSSTVDIVARYNISSIQITNRQITQKDVVDQEYDISRLPIGDHTIILKISTSDEYFGRPLSFTIGHSPQINLSDIELTPLEYREGNGGYPLMQFSVIVSIPEKSATVTLYLYFNNYGDYLAYVNAQIQNYTRIIPSSTRLDNRYLLDGTNYINFYATYNGHFSETINTSFLYFFNKPILNITTPDNQTFKKNDNTEFNMEGTMKCDYECHNVSIFYQFDDYEVNTIINNFPMELNKAIEDSYPVEFPSDMTEGNNHSFRIWVTDFNNRTSMVTKNFSYLFDIPKIEVSQAPKESYTDFVDDIINVTGFVSHPYHTGQLSVLYRFDDELTTNVTSSPIQVESSNEKHQFNFTFQIPSTTNEGQHKITIWAQDERGVKSNIQNFIFGFEHNSPPEIVSFDISPLEFFKNGLTPMEINVRIGDINGAKMP